LFGASQAVHRNILSIKITPANAENIKISLHFGKLLISAQAAQNNLDPYKSISTTHAVFLIR
jgi:hypothetical protein